VSDDDDGSARDEKQSQASLTRTVRWRNNAGSSLCGEILRRDKQTVQSLQGFSFNLVSRSCSPSREFTLGLTDECIGRAYLKLKNRSVIKAFFSAFSHIHKPILKGQRHTLIACVTRRFVSSSCSVCSTYYFGFPNEQQESSSWVPFSLFRPALKHWLSQISHLGTTFANCAIIASSPLCIAHSLHQLNTVWYRHQLPAPASEEV